MSKKITWYRDFDAMPAVLTPEDCANILGLSYEQVRKLCREGKLPAAKFGKVWRVRKEDLQALFNRREEGAA